jgi:SAM-dependent methyltransferase
MYAEAGISRSEIKRIIRSYDKWYQRIRFGFLLQTHGTPTNLRQRLTAEWSFWARRVLGRKTREEVFKDALPDVAGKTVIDVGCNAGLKSLEASCRGAAFVFGVDSNPAAIQQANHVLEICRKLGRPLGRIEFRHVDDINNQLSLLDDKDVLIACCVLYHLGDLTRFRQRIVEGRISLLVLQGNTARLSKHQSRSIWEGNSLCNADGMAFFCKTLGFEVERVAFPKHQYPVVIARRKTR